MLDAALAYAAAGWPVFPCDWRPDPPGAKRRRAKSPLVPGADKDANGEPIPKTGGLWRATTDGDQIRAWWRRWPNALIGVPMGARSGVFAIDLDPHEGEEGGEPLDDTLARLAAAVGELPAGPRVLTQSGGLHLYFALPADGGEMPRNSAKRLKGVDWRGEGGYVVVPPSTLAGGGAYRWLVGAVGIPCPEGLPALAPPAPPAALLDLVFQRGTFAKSAGRDRPRPPDGGQGDRQTADTASRTPGRRSADEPGEKACRAYARAALDRAGAEMAACPRGRRGHTLNMLAHGLAPFVALGLLTEREVFASLQDGADASGLTATDGPVERDAKISRGLAAGLRDKATGPLEARLAEIAEEARARARRRESWGARQGGAPREASVAAPSPPPAGQDGDPGPEQGAPPAASPGGQGAPGGGPPARRRRLDPAILAACAGLPPNDYGNGQRLLAWFREEVLFVQPLGWHVWTGTHWDNEEGDRRGLRLAHETALRIAFEAGEFGPTERERAAIEAAEAQAPPPDVETREEAAARKSVDKAAARAWGAVYSRRDARVQFAIDSGNGGKAREMLKAAAPYRTVASGAMDADPLKLNVRNGTLVFSRARDEECSDVSASVALRPHDRADLMTRLAPASWRADAAAPRWQAFLDRFQPDRARQAFLQRYFGYAATGLFGEQVLVFFHGGGSNGKSTFLESIARVLGPYAQILEAESVTGTHQRRGDQATPDLVKLPGARLVRVSEIPRGVPIKEELIKRITGGEPMLARPLNKEFFEFTPTFKTVLSGNDEPKIHGTDYGIWRRILLVPWEVTIPEAERRPMEAVLAELMEERDGILGWLVAGALAYLAEGLAPPADIRAATEDLKADLDPVGRFLAACVEPMPPDQGFSVTGGEMFKAYQAWCGESGEKVFSMTFFGRECAKRLKKTKSDVVRYLDVRLKNVPSAPGAGSPAPPDDSY